MGIFDLRDRAAPENARRKAKRVGTSYGALGHGAQVLFAAYDKFAVNSCVEKLGTCERIVRLRP